MNEKSKPKHLYSRRVEAEYGTVIARDGDGITYGSEARGVLARVERLEARVDALESQLEAVMGDPPETVMQPQDPFHAWMEEHEDEARPYEGQRVAFMPERGVVAAAPTLDAVFDQVDALGLTDDEVIYAVIPAGYFGYFG